MPSLDDSIMPVGLLRSKHNGRFELVVRWVMGAKGDRLPRTDESFQLTVRRTKKTDGCGDPAADFYFDPDAGTFGAAGVKHAINVAPQNFAMIDPPREPFEFGPPSNKRVWDLAVKPSKPINPVCPIGHGKLPDGEAFGVYHLLCESQKSRAEWRAAHAIMKPVCTVVEHILGRNPVVKEWAGSSDATVIGAVIAGQLSHWIVRTGCYAKSLTLTLKKAYEGLLHPSDHAARTGPAAWDIFSPHPALTAEVSKIAPEAASALQWLYAEVVAEVLKVPGIRYELEAIVDQRTRLREQLRLRAFQGGKLLDFWCSPSTTTPACAEGMRGRQHPQSELLGLGLSLGDFPSTELAAWVAAGEALLINLDPLPAEKQKSRRPSGTTQSHQSKDLMIAGKDIITSLQAIDGEAGDFILLKKGEDAPLDPGCYRIEPIPKAGRQASIKKALDVNSSMPPHPPFGAHVNYDLVQANVGKVTGDRDSEGQLTQQLDYVTGDGRVQIQIEHPADNPDLNIAGFNVYAMWECDATRSYFVSPTNPGSATTKELRSWRITRRYSFERDLRGAFPGLYGKLPKEPNEFDSGQLEDPPSYEVDPAPASYVTDPEIRAIIDPPSQPVILRPETVYDLHEKAKGAYNQSYGTEPKNDTVAMPSKTQVGVTQYDIDLRLGMDSGLSADKTMRKFVGWDTQFHVKTEWSPTQKRNGDAAGIHPQRYRFWVTAVDAFEQESIPVPVGTNDIAVGEATVTYLFEPKYRAALQPPPATEPRQIDLVEDVDIGFGPFKLKIVWHTPYLSEVGKYGSSAIGKRAPRKDVRANVVLLRKRQKVANDRDLKRRSSASLPPQFDLPQWRNSLKRWERLEWEVVTTWVDIDGGAGAHPDAPWEITWVGRHIDRGHDYVALIAATIDNAPAARAFWTCDAKKTGAGPTTGRRVQLLDCDGTDDPKYTMRFDYIDELPTASEVAETGTLPVANLQASRNVLLRDRLEFVRAKPILAPPGIFRDHVLTKLLTHPVKRGDVVVAPVPWGPGKVPLTDAQKAMLEAALDRAVSGRGDIDEYLEQARLVLSRDFISGSAQESQPDYRQHASLGFRGLQELAFSYTPNSVAPLRNTESEAERVSVFNVRVPRAVGAARNYATCISKAEFVSRTNDILTYRMIEVPDEATMEAIASICTGVQPSLAVIFPLSMSSGEAEDVAGHAGDVIGVSGDARPTVNVRFSAAETPATPPPAVELRFYLSQLLLGEEIVNHESETTYRMYVPAGGGPAELFAWWIGTSSAKGVTSGLGKAPFIVRRFNPTIMPDAIQQFSASAPLKGPNYFLNPAQFAKWLPTTLTTPEDAVRLPRLVLSWDYSESDSATYMLIERRQRRLDKPNDRTKTLRSGITPWEAIKEIEALPELDNDSKPSFLQASWVEAIRKNWLIGSIVDVEGDVPQLFPLIGFPLNDPTNPTLPHNTLMLSASRGLGKDTIGDGKRPAFIDYFQQLGDLDQAMDANYEYSYRAMAFIDLGEQSFGAAELTDPLNWQWRYLLSYPTSWTNFRPPETSAIDVRPEELSPQTINSVGPIVRLEFVTASTKRTGTRGESELEEWRYRVIVQRKRDFSIPSSPGARIDAGWEDVGNPVSVWPGQSVLMDDLDVERDLPESDLSVSYQIRVSQIHARTVEGKRIESVVRGGGEQGVTSLAVMVPHSQNPNTEVLSRVKIRLL